MLFGKTDRDSVKQRGIPSASSKYKGTSLASSKQRGTSSTSLQQKGTSSVPIKELSAQDLKIKSLDIPVAPVPGLSYGLERVLFNPGVYHMQDPRSRVFNFDPYLHKVMPVEEFNFNALGEYITSSRDTTLKEIAIKYGKRYVGSSSSMTGALAHFHFLLSQWRPINIKSLSKGFLAQFKTFTILSRSPTSIFLRWNGSSYAIDADKEFDTPNILAMLGKSMEKLLTLPKEEYERYRKSNLDNASDRGANNREPFHYSSMGDILMRSQLDAYDNRLPGTGMFDLKTRSVIPIRMEARNYKSGMGYEIKSILGEYESFEREYFDMIRSAFLKYSLQVRMGRMDGIFVAYHNIERIFGFQYMSLAEMDSTIHGAWDTNVGDQEFKLSIDLLNKILDRATEKFPEKSLRIHFETRDTQTPFMYIFAEPMEDEKITEIQSASKHKFDIYEREILGLNTETEPQEDIEVQETLNTPQSKWEAIQATVEQEMEMDELFPLGSTAEQLAASDEKRHADNTTMSRENKDDGDLTCPSMPVLQTGEDKIEPNETNKVGIVENENEAETEQKEPLLIDVGDQAETDREETFSVEDGGGNVTSTVEQEHQENPETLRLLSIYPIVPVKTDGDKKWLNLINEKLKDIPTPIQNPEVLAMTLTIRNKINGEYQIRPEILGENDEWSIEYSLAEVTTHSRSWTLYKACQARRRAALTFEEEDDEKASYFIQNLRALSIKGRMWRKNQDELDSKRAISVLGQAYPTANTSVETADSTTSDSF
ncbi:MAG: hypothetical protein M1829_005987 [Trizodia sp. TS-e1964]|nr:MAG: hypothetical protein M1829_005987 [Trizodia sp. TS-e1964]